MSAAEMAGNPTVMLVVAAAIRDGEGRLLLQQRPLHKRHGGQWEFPGGKVEPGESPRPALAREIEEELGVALDIAAMEPAGFAEESGANGVSAIVLFLYTCRAFAGEPTGREGQNWGWFTLTEAAELDLAPMDRALLAKLRE
ncbi:NUDIX domain-containing protein [Altererythrobacter sp. B11]|uniref:(deoxy)nucleoside triphosphate pyrophosphohydrolase n=1 Tax=Altererythrobacter sp. B11 TaxID=2060312 RepID=UPI000DC6EC38|nr:(deoxy)nucleoside triphosphate pyrophosphohydrolase [Altererythrobacter sp. B11]BBC72865.1 NUDIX domain-containing protein [Altererythrobacter sp. B11]